MKSAQDVENLHHNVVLATLFGSSDGAIGLRCNGLVIGARKQYRYADAQRKCRICPITALLQGLE